ncbi:MAG: polysaccharide deacetylase family protein [Saprospiraceae bacterium]|nr:polysaccharide deacetylase family protein [Saprospiraceae bacterium]
MDRLISLSGRDIIFPFYHIVTDEIPIHAKHRYGIKSVKDFESDLEFLLKHFKALDLNDVLSLKRNKLSGKKPGFFLTFDDGLSEFYNVVAPILLRKGIPAACFINSAFVDNKQLFYRYKSSILIHHLKENKNLIHLIDKNTIAEKSHENIIKQILTIDYSERHVLEKIATSVDLDFNKYLETQKPYMDAVQISSLINQGFYFGAHSIDHPLYSKITLKEQIFQTETSLAWVKKQFNQNFSLFAFPFTDHGVSKSYFDHFSENKVVDLSFGSAGIKKEKIMGHYQRIPMEVPGNNAENILSSEYFYYLLKSFVGKNRIRRHD